MQEIHQIGLKKQINDFDLVDLCHHYGYLSHNEVLEFQKNCDALLITSSKVISGRDYSIAGKTYEYFTIGKPIIAFVCEGEQKDILIESGMAVILNPDETNESSNKLLNLFSGDIKLKPNIAEIEKYQRKKLTEKLSEIVKKLKTS